MQYITRAGIICSALILSQMPGSLSLAQTKPEPPELTSLSVRSAPPGTSITISGKRFSTKSQSNKVYFGSVEATATGGNADSLTVTIPEMNYPQVVEVSVTSNGVKSSNHLELQVGNREF